MLYYKFLHLNIPVLHFWVDNFHIDFTHNCRSMDLVIGINMRELKTTQTSTDMNNQFEGVEFYIIILRIFSCVVGMNEFPI